MISTPWRSSYGYVTLPGNRVFANVIKVTNQLTLKQEDYLYGPNLITRAL